MLATIAYSVYTLLLFIKKHTLKYHFLFIVFAPYIMTYIMYLLGGISEPNIQNMLGSAALFQFGMLLLSLYILVADMILS